MSIDGAPSESVVVDLLSGLVVIDSVNPDLVPGGVGESELAAFCWDWLIDRGCEVHRQSTGRPGGENVVGVVVAAAVAAR